MGLLGGAGKEAGKEAVDEIHNDILPDATKDLGDLIDKLDGVLQTNIKLFFTGIHGVIDRIGIPRK